MTTTTSSLDCKPRWATRRTDRPTYGANAILAAEAMGFELMPWQRQVLDTALEHDPVTRKLVYREVVVTIPRQSGKTTLLLVLFMWRALMWTHQTIVYTAQTGAVCSRPASLSSITRPPLAGWLAARPAGAALQKCSSATSRSGP